MSGEQTKTSRVDVNLKRVSPVHYEVTNGRGSTISVGHGDDVFSPVELLLAAVGACSSIDVDVVTTRRADPEKFDVSIAGDVEKGPEGNRVKDVDLNFSLSFPDTDEGRTAQSLVARLVKLSHDKDCTVGRTVMLPTELHSAVDGEVVA